MKKTETAKYILVTDHRANFNYLDEKIMLKSTDMLHAMKEAFDAVYDDEQRYDNSFPNLYAMYIYEKSTSATKGFVEYNEILRGNFHLNKNAVSGNTFSGWEPVLNKDFYLEFDYVNEYFNYKHVSHKA